ncbi:PadR family transcriptional regulator [Agromyces endophyticus]|uniref:PadR family transcriptional regulator n=1 Tax=Agromyces sp. H17E-10 TaxID=2932244 RepID=UPI001FCF8D03|nr:PadR family transcriptional regulator [Agromyces sp. H17E-10]UOQ87837.1 PadR family transcriptional regulator [Agromyces sp. H17E-10]
MTTTLSPLGVTVLALLVERDMHAYEMYQLMLERKEDKVVKVSPGSVYRAVERFAADGLIDEVVVERQGNRPERTVYAITETGREALRETITAMLRRHVNEFPEFPVAIGEAHNLPAGEVVELLGERLDSIREVLAAIDGSLERIAERELPTAYVLDLHYSRALLAAEATWLEQTIDDLGSGALAWPAKHRH